MKVIKIKKQNIVPNIKPINDKVHLKNRQIAYHKKNNIKQNSSKKNLNKRLSLSFEENKTLKSSDNKINNSFDNPLELDYLNFSKIDLFKFNQSFEDDIFTPNNKNKKRIVEDRYEDTISTMNGNSTIKNDENNLIAKNLDSNISGKGNIMNTSSSLCNYYGQSTNKKNGLNSNSNDLKQKLCDDIKKNLTFCYNKNSEKKENNNQKQMKNENSNKNNKNSSNIILNNEKPSTKYFKQNLKSNSVLHNNKKSQISYLDRVLQKKENEFPKSENKQKKVSKNKNKINIKKKYSKSNEKLEYKNINQSSTKNVKEEISQINKNNKYRISNNSIKEKNKKQKPLNLYYNQNRYDTYFITPRGIKKRKSDKNLSSNKNNKISINTGPISKNKSFVTNKTNNIKNDLIFMNNNETNIPDNSNYKMIKELISDFEINTNQLNKTTPKNKAKIKGINSSKKDFIRVNLKNSTKSSTNFGFTQKNNFINSKSPSFYPFNKNIKNPNSKMKSEMKNSFNIYKNIGKNDLFSPVSKNQPSINFEAQKTLTEQNAFVHKIQQVTPKNYKIQKFDSVPFTAMVKTIFVGSNKKDNLIKFNSSLKTKENTKIKTEQMKCIFKPKTQSDLKEYEQIFGFCGDYGNDKHVKQKLLDRMNKASNNWQYIFSGNNNKKKLDDGISNFRNNHKMKEIEDIDCFNKNESIISDGSEKEDEN